MLLSCYSMVERIFIFEIIQCTVQDSRAFPALPSGLELLGNCIFMSVLSVLFGFLEI